MKVFSMKNYKGARCLVTSEQHINYWVKKGRGVEPYVELEYLVCRMVIGFLNSRHLVGSRTV